MNTIIDLAKMDVEQLCEMFNDKDGILEKAGIDPNDIIREFINRGVASKYPKGSWQPLWPQDANMV